MSSLVAVLVAFAVVTISPGPANLAVSVAAMGQGARHGLRMAAGLSVGLAFWGVVAASGMGAILAASEFALTVMRVIGGGYLLWLAWTSARAALASEATSGPAINTTGFRGGVMLNLTNPKAVLAWLAALSLGLDASGSVATLVLATSLCALIGVANYIGWALIMSRSTFRVGYQRARGWIDGTAAALFGLAGAELLRQSVAR